jgi:hypothetical protein
VALVGSKLNVAQKKGVLLNYGGLELRHLVNGVDLTLTEDEYENLKDVLVNHFVPQLSTVNQRFLFLNVLESRWRQLPIMWLAFTRMVCLIRKLMMVKKVIDIEMIRDLLRYNFLNNLADKGKIGDRAICGEVIEGACSCF